MLHDIRPYREAKGGRFQCSAYSMGAGATFLPGEPVAFDGTGFIVEASTDPSNIAGIAAESSIDIEGRIRPTGIGISVMEPLPSQLWVCNQFSILENGTPAAPTQANSIGKLAGLVILNNQWVVSTGAGNPICRIDDVMDKHGVSITNPNFVRGPGYHVIFRFV